MTIDDRFWNNLKVISMYERFCFVVSFIFIEIKEIYKYFSSVTFHFRFCPDDSAIVSIVPLAFEVNIYTIYSLLTVYIW